MLHLDRLLPRAIKSVVGTGSILSRRCKATHTVFNQSTPLVDFNLFDSDPALNQYMSARCSQEELDLLSSFGEMAGSSELMEAADSAEKNRPVLRQFDQFGNRIDVVDYHQTYHTLMDFATFNGVSADGFKINQPGSHLLRCAKGYMENQLEPGHMCPITMTCAAIPVLQKNPGMEHVVEKIFARAYDPRNLPVEEKTGVTIGMSMTEKQGGSDVRANTTIATPANPNKTGQGEAYLLNGHKWFTSAPMCDGFLTLAKLTEESPPSCFFVPRWKPDGSRNTGFQIMRLKDKLADRANASSEVEYCNAYGTMLGEPNRGVKTIIEMVQSTRLDCILGSAGHARRALQQGLNHARSRKVFGKLLVDQPVMQNVLADLCIESEAHTLTAMHMASAFDKYYAGSSESEKNVFRLGVSVGKYYVTKRLPQFTYECLEVFGGNGFVEEQPMAKMFRHAPLNAIWEGSGNVIALDILKGFGALPHLWADVSSVRGADSVFDSYCDSLYSVLENVAADPMHVDNQRAARNIVERLAIAMQGSILLRHGDSTVAEAFIASRIAQDTQRVGAGGLHGGAATYSGRQAKAIIDRNMPMVGVDSTSVHVMTR